MTSHVCEISDEDTGRTFPRRPCGAPTAAEAPTASRAAPQSVRPLRRPAMDGSGDCKLAHARDLHSTCLVPHRIRPVRPRLRGWRARRRRRGRRRRSRRPDRVQRWPETQVAASAERPHRWATERERRGAPGAADRWKRSRAPGNARTGRGVRWPAGRRRATARQFRRPRVDPRGRALAGRHPHHVRPRRPRLRRPARRREWLPRQRPARPRARRGGARRSPRRHDVGPIGDPAPDRDVHAPGAAPSLLLSARSAARTRASRTAPRKTLSNADDHL